MPNNIIYKKTILIIEDDLATIDIYKTVLEKAGFGVDVADCGKQAFEKIREIESGRTKKPDLVFLDIILPDTNGIEILKEIRKGEKTKDLSIFVLTNYTDEQLKKIGLEFKWDEYLLKTDYLPSKLVEMVKEKLGVK